MSEELHDSPPTDQHDPDTPPEHDPHAEEADLIHVELGEALAAVRRPPPPPRTPPPLRVRRGPILAFLHVERLPGDRGSGNAPLAAWIIVQLTAIAASAARWKFWAMAGVGNAPSIELLALHTLLVAQLITATLIYPVLVDTWRKLAWAAITLVAFDAIAWVMTDVSLIAGLWACGCVLAWIVGLAAWRAAAPGAFATMVIRLMLTLAVLGWPIVAYLHVEFATDGSGGFAGFAGGGPIVAFLTQLRSDRLVPPAGITALAVAGSGTAAVLLRLYRQRHRPAPLATPE